MSKDPLDYRTPPPEILRAQRNRLSCAVVFAFFVGLLGLLSFFLLYNVSTLLALALIVGVLILAGLGYATVTILGWSAATAIFLTAGAAVVLMFGLCSQTGHMN